MGVIRLLLALSVLIDHSGPILGLYLVGGETAVQCFFVISGFYMALILNEKYTGKNSSWKLFISNRLLRLMPLYWLILFLILFKSFLLFFYTKGSTASHLEPFFQYGSDLHVGSWLALIFTNLCILGQDVLMFMGLNPDTGALYFTKDFTQSHPPVYTLLLIPQAWSIALELMFYALAPFLLRKHTGIILTFFIASLLLRILLYSNGLNFDPWTYRFFPTELALFLAGSLGYRFYDAYLKNSQAHLRCSKYIFATLIVMILFYSTISLEYQRLIFTTLFIFATPYIFAFTKDFNSDRTIGELSYPVYLVHLFIGSMILYLPFTAWLGKGVTLALLSILFAWIFHVSVGERLERFRQKRIS